MKRIAFLEFDDELEALISYAGSNGLKMNEFYIIALDPKVQSTLTRLGLAYDNSLPYFSNESHKRIILENKKAYDIISRSFQYADSIGLKETYLTELKFYVGFYRNHISRLIEIILNVVNKNPDCQIYAGVDLNFGDQVMINAKDRYLGRVAREIAKKQGLKSIDIFEGTRSVCQAQKDNYTNHASLGEAIFFRFALIYKKVFKKRAVIVPGRGYGFDELLSSINRNMKSIMFITLLENASEAGLLKRILKFFFGIDRGHFYLDPRSFSAKPGKGLQKAFNACINDSNFCQYREFDFKDVILPKLKRSLLPHMLRLEQQCASLASMFDVFGVKLAISCFSRGIWFGIGELSRIKGFRSLFISHGTHPVPVDAVHEAEMLELCKGFMLGKYTHIALSTPVQEEHLRYFKSKYPEIENEGIMTGPLIFSKIDIGKDEAKKNLGINSRKYVVTYAVTTKSRAGMRYYFLETEDEYISSLADIIGAVDKVADAFLIIRVHPGYHLSNDVLKTLLPKSDNYCFQNSGFFSKVLAATDVLISYSSTAMDEALINKIPVMIYDKWKRYNNYKLDEYSGGDIREPAVYITDGKLLVQALNKIKEIREEISSKGDFSSYRYNEVREENLYEYIQNSI